MAQLEDVARAIVAPGKGILAADESDGTIEKRFKSIDVESTEANRRDYREMLFRTDGAEKFISGVILFDETLRQEGVTSSTSTRSRTGTSKSSLTVVATRHGSTGPKSLCGMVRGFRGRTRWPSFVIVRADQDPQRGR